MKIQYLQSFALVFLAGLVIASFPVSAASAADTSGGTITRSSSFTVSLTGMPNTPYYIWLPGTFTMTGEPGDQPPVIADNTENVVKDPPNGPYTIGSYAYFNGGGRTIRDDVAPSTAQMPDTNYYAQVTTDENGRAIVEFQTSLNTATRSFSVKAENPRSPGGDNLQLEETLYSRTAPGPMIITPTEIPATTTPLLTPVPAAVPETSTPVPTTPLPTATPARQAPLETGIVFLSFSAGLIVVRRW